MCPRRNPYMFLGKKSPPLNYMRTATRTIFCVRFQYDKQHKPFVVSVKLPAATHRRHRTEFVRESIVRTVILKLHSYNEEHPNYMQHRELGVKDESYILYERGY